MNIAVLTPAYGHDYGNKNEVIEAFDLNRDFILANINSPYCGKPCSKNDLVKAGYSHAEIRYKKLQRLVMIEL